MDADQTGRRRDAEFGQLSASRLPAGVRAAARSSGGWLLVAALTVPACLGADALALPAPELFGGVLGGLLAARWSAAPAAPPRPAALASQSVIGVTLGTLVSVRALDRFAVDAVAIAAVAIATIGLSLISGRLLSRWTGLDRPTAMIGMVAGGASGLTAVSHELGADDRLVAVLQYTRVLLILGTLPLVARLAGSEGVPVLEPGRGTAVLPALGFLVVCVVAGRALARLGRLPVGSLLGPMFLAAAASASGVASGLGVPPQVQAVAYAVIGLQAGLRCRRGTLSTAARILPVSLALTLGLLVACGALGLVLESWTRASALDGYLATTPGGLYAVLATAARAGSEPTFVLSVQVLRLFLVLSIVPLLARRWA